MDEHQLGHDVVWTGDLDLQVLMSFLEKFHVCSPFGSCSS
jgi:hypothetical protein